MTLFTLGRTFIDFLMTPLACRMERIFSFWYFGVDTVATLTFGVLFGVVTRCTIGSFLVGLVIKSDGSHFRGVGDFFGAG